jgi:hypothetical protein
VTTCADTCTDIRYCQAKMDLQAIVRWGHLKAAA